jgi:hypothetical protein
MTFIINTLYFRKYNNDYIDNDFIKKYFIYTNQKILSNAFCNKTSDSLIY